MVRDTVTVVTVMDEIVYRVDIGFDETVIDVTFVIVTLIIVTVSDVKVSWSVYKILDKCILIGLDVSGTVSVFMFLSLVCAVACVLCCVLLTAVVKRETLHCWRVYGYSSSC